MVIILEKRKIVEYLSKISLDLFVYFGVITLVVVASYFIQDDVGEGLASYPDSLFDWNYKPPWPPMNASYVNYTVLLDGHSHTTYSDGNLNPKQSIEWHLANGYNAMIVTDHNDLKGALETQKLAREKYDDKIKVLIGFEYSCCRIHMNLIGITDTSLYPTEAFPSDEEMQRVINKTHELGGLVVVNHIPWSLNGDTLVDHPTIEQLYKWGVDYVEVAGQNRFDYQDWQFAIKTGMGVITGTDMHSPNRGVNAWTTLITDSFTEDAIWDELKARRTSFIFSMIDSPFGANAKVTYKNLILDPFFRMGNLAISYYSNNHGMYSFTGSFCRKTHIVVEYAAVFIMLFWLIVFFILFHLLRALILLIANKIKAKCSKRKARRNDEMELRPLIEDDIIPIKRRTC